MTPSALYSNLEAHCDDLLAADEDHVTIADAMNAKTWSVKSLERSTTTTLLDRLEPTEYETLRTTLENVGHTSPYVRGINEALAGEGVLLSDDRAKGFIESLRPYLGDDLTEKVKAIGVQVHPVLPEPVTAEDVAAARQWHALSQQLAAAKSRATEALDAGGDWSAIVAAFTE